METAELKARVEKWIELWNRHDLAGLMEHYADDVELHSPYVAERWKLSEGKISGIELLRKHFVRTFEAVPGSTLKLLNVLKGLDGYIIVYQRPNGLISADLVAMNAEGKVKSIRAYYGESLGTVGK